MMEPQVARFSIRQRFSYVYPAPIRNLRHRLIVSPHERHAGQRRIAESLRVTPDVCITKTSDALGNSIVHFFAERIDRTLEIEIESTIERRAGFEIRATEPHWLTDTAFRAWTPLTQADSAILAAARRLRAESSNDVELAAAINAFVFDTMSYRKDVTDVTTTAAQAFALRAGVCQDYAHVMLALTRECGLAARYVSGHLLGEGGTHAWVEILLPSEDGGAVAWPFDPTHNRRESLDYIVVAIGRDYADVAPTSGTFEAPYNGVLTAEKKVDRLDAA